MASYWNIVFLLICTVFLHHAAGQCEIPSQFQGSFFSIETGTDLDTLINERNLENQLFTGECIHRWDDNTTLDAEGNHNSKLLLYDRGDSECYKCYYMFFRTPNVVQYKTSDCRTSDNGVPSLESVCDDIPEASDYFTFFRKNYETVNCKNTFEGTFNFTYEWNVGGGGVCESEQSVITACQEPGSPYVDNQVFTMEFGKCPEISTSTNEEIRFLCMGTWIDDDGNVWSGLSDMGKDVYREKFRCMLTTYGQEEGDNKQRYTLSWWADCSELKSAYDGPLRLLLQPVVGDFQLAYAQPQCNFPTNYSGVWFHSGEYDVDVSINATHIYFKTKLDEFNYKEAYFVCLMNSGTRYMTMAVTVGKCEIDYLCLDMLPRHHSIIRWRMGKPYRLTEVEMAYPDFEMYMFRQACTWYSFTLDREDIEWNYKTFLLNPPVPIDCPIRGRYYFDQSGPETELIRTRIEGITERPRHMIDCTNYVTEWRSCDNNPSKIQLDAEYCETVDHTGRPVGEYDEPDWELTCVGYWDEDWKSYMVTWDPEDPTSAYRCWVYEREDWRYVVASRSTTSFCQPIQTARSSDPKEGGSLSLRLVENERLYDDCAQAYLDDNPWTQRANRQSLEGSGVPKTFNDQILNVMISLALSLMLCICFS